MTDGVMVAVNPHHPLHRGLPRSADNDPKLMVLPWNGPGHARNPPIWSLCTTHSALKDCTWRNCWARGASSPHPRSTTRLRRRDSAPSSARSCPNSGSGSALAKARSGCPGWTCSYGCGRPSPATGKAIARSWGWNLFRACWKRFGHLLS